MFEYIRKTQLHTFGEVLIWSRAPSPPQKEKKGSRVIKDLLKKYREREH
jgi:hypothetical protein